MDPLIFQAARDGNVGTFLELVERDPLVLERPTASSTADSPLHIAAMLGHFRFVEELIKYKINAKDYAKELNQDGFSPMHLASANGHVQVVKQLSKVSHELCSIKGKDGLTPLHCASIKGRVEIISRLIQASWSSVLEETARGETALHLAVKNNQLGALEILVACCKQNNILDKLNWKDEEGNTVLHIAAVKRNRQAVELLLDCNNSEPGVLEVNAINKSGLTALDLVLLCPCDSSYTDIERLLRSAGTERARFLTNTDNPAPLITTGPTTLSREAIIDWRDYFKFQFNRSKPDKVRSDLLVVAVLMATATYQAVLSPPGGVAEQGTNEGQARLAANPFSYIWYIFCNSVGFFMSIYMIMVLLENYPLYWEMFVAIVAMAATYDAAMIKITPPGGVRNFFIGLAIFLPALISIASLCIRKWRKRHGRGVADRRGVNV